jgi:hypothetical protein
MRDGGNDFLTPLFDIVIRPDANRFDLLLRTDDMFQRGAKFRGEAAMGHEDDSNHQTYLFIQELRARPVGIGVSSREGPYANEGMPRKSYPLFRFQHGFQVSGKRCKGKRFKQEARPHPDFAAFLGSLSWFDTMAQARLLAAPFAKVSMRG